MMKGKLSRKMFFSLIAALFIVISTITLLTACNDNEKPSGDNEITVMISQTFNGTVTADKEKYLSGDTVTLTFAPDDGYELNAVSVNEINRTSAVRNGELVMENVTENLTVTTTFLARATGSVSYSIKNNIGGTAQLSKTSGYIGERVTLTLTPERGYDVMSVVVNGGVNIANAIKNNSIEIELTQAVNTVEVEFYAFPIKVFATANDYGTVSIDNEKEIYALDDTVEIVLTPNAGCILDSLLVNGEEKIDEVSGNKLTFTISEIGNINVTAVFTLQPVHIDFAVSATRFGDNYDIKGASVEFKHENGKKYHDITINDESKIAADVVPGKYTVTIDGFAPVQLTVGTDGYTTQTTFVYNPFRESVAWNTSGYADGKINNSAYGHLLAKDDFDNFVLTVTLKNTGVRTSINFKYGSKMIGFSNDGNSAGLWLPGTTWGNIPWSDTAYETPSPDWYANDFANTAYSVDGAEFKFVRQGTKLYLFVEDTYVTSWEIFTADQKISFALTGWGSGEISVNISTDTDTVNGLVESNVTASTVTNGTVAFDKTDGKYTLGDTVMVTLTPKAEEVNAKYVLESLILDGETVSLDRVNNGVFTFKISKNTHTVSATFKSVAIANIDVAVTASKFGEIQSLSEVVLSNANYNSVHQLNGGKLQVSGLAEGTYTVSADGYIPATIEVKVEGSSTVAQLVYNHFATSGDWTVTADSENNISISSGSEFSHLFFKEAQGDFALTYNIKKIATQGERRLAFTVKYGDNKMLAFTNVWNNDYGMSIPTGDWNIVWDGASHTYTGDWRTLEFTETEKAAYNSDSGINVSIVRQGTTLYVFFGERFVSRYELFNATEKVECAFTGWSLFNDSNEKFIIPVELEVKDTVISALVESNVAVDAVNHGTVTLDKADGKYKIGDTVELTLAADTHTDENKKYVLKTLTVGGQPVDLSEINSGVYTFKAIKSSYTVAATFEEVNIVNLNIQITATKFGVEQTLNKVTLSGVNYSAQEIDLTNGRLVVNGLADDTYRISIEGYLPVTVSNSTESATLIYLPFVDAEGWNTSNYADGKVSNSAFGHLLSKDEFDNFVLTVTLKKTSVRTSINFKYEENVIGFSTDGNSAGLWLPGNNDVIQPSWQGLTYHSISPDWYANEFANNAYGSDGAEYKFVRQGTELYLFVENTYVASWEIFEETQKVEFALTGWGIGEISLAISTDMDTVNGLVESNVTVGTVTNGDVTLNKTNGKYFKGDNVTLTITPATHSDSNKKYVLSSLTIDGQSIDVESISESWRRFQERWGGNYEGYLPSGVRAAVFRCEHIPICKRPYISYRSPRRRTVARHCVHARACKLRLRITGRYGLCKADDTVRVS